MKDPGNVIIRTWPEGNFGRAWIDLLESKASEKARMCYVAMTSFGSESRAGNKSIMRRMGVKSINTVKAAQAELVGLGWIRRVSEATDTKPAIWEMLHHPHGQPLIPPVSTIDTPRYQPLIPKQEDKQEPKQEQESATALPDTPASIPPPKKQLSKKQLEILPALPWIKHFKELWEKKMKDTWPTETGAVKEILRYQSEGVTFDQFKAKVAAYLALDSDNYVAQERWGLMVLLRWRWTKIAATTKPTLPPHLQKPESAI